jgi:SAM-dependent methyltransferase
MAPPRVLHRQTFVLPGGHILPDWYDVIACGECGFVYADTVACQGTYDKYYAEMSKYETNYTAGDTAMFVDRARWISALMDDKNAAIADIGCGNGQLLLELQKMGFGNLTALDPSSRCIRDIQRKGINGMVGSVFDVPPSRTYDGVVLSGVLEHICDVHGMMTAIKRFICPQGLLFVFVPDASRYCEYDAVAWDYFNIEHINHFEEVSLLNLGFVHGLRMINFLKTDITFFDSKQPVIFCAYRNEGALIKEIKNHAQHAIKQYIQQTQQKQEANRIIDRLVASQEEIVVWGAGNYTSRLLATTALGNCNVLGYVDNDKHKQGKCMGGRTVHAPRVLLDMDGKATILVAVAVFRAEIIAEIKKLGLQNEVIVV